MDIIPAIDIIDGKCVRLVQGDYRRCTTYRNDPVEVAREFADYGLCRLHLVDLDGARLGQVTNLKVLERICNLSGVQVDFGGGIKSGEDVRDVFTAGAGWICVGSVALTNVEMVQKWMVEHGSERVIIGADVRNGKICIRGWKEETAMSVAGLMESYGSGVKHLMCTDISRDGMFAGPSVEYYRDLIASWPSIEVIASGGVASLEDIRELSGIGVAGVIIGKAIYEGRISLAELSKMKDNK